MGESSGAMSNLSVWIVDDNLVSLFAARYGIERWSSSCTVITMDSPIDALARLAEMDKTDLEFPDVILLDLKMPTMSGWEFLEEFEKIEKEGAQTDIYILSSFINSKDQFRAGEFKSVKGCFPKPISKHIFSKIFHSSVDPLNSAVS